MESVYNKLTDCYKSLAKKGDRRFLDSYFRVGFHGFRFGDLHMKEFIYKEEALMKLSEFSLKLEASIIIMLSIAFIISFLSILTSFNLSPLPPFSLSLYFSFLSISLLSLPSLTLSSLRISTVSSWGLIKLRLLKILTKLIPQNLTEERLTYK